MNKLIAAIEALPDGKKLVYAVSTNEVVHGYNYACTTDDLKALVAQLKWIPVSERLPEGYDAGNVRANVWDNVGANVWDNVGAYATATAKIERLEKVINEAIDELYPKVWGNTSDNRGVGGQTVTNESSESYIERMGELQKRLHLALEPKDGE